MRNSIYLLLLCCVLFSVNSCNISRKPIGEDTVSLHNGEAYDVKYYGNSLLCEIYNSDTLVLAGDYIHVEALSDTMSFCGFIAHRKDSVIEVYDASGALLIDSLREIVAFERIISSDLPGPDLYYKTTTKDGRKGVYRPGFGHIVEPKFESVSGRATYLERDNNFNTSGHMAWFDVTLNDSIALISTDGRTLVPLGEWEYATEWHINYDRTGEYGIQSAQVYGDWGKLDGFEVKTKRGTRGLYSLDGVQLVPPIYQKIYAVYNFTPENVEFYKGVDALSTYGLYNSKGKEIVAPGKYSDLEVEGVETESSIKFIFVSYGENEEETVGALDFEGNEMVPLLKGRYIRCQDGELQFLRFRKPNEDIEDWYKYEWQSITPSLIAKYKASTSSRQSSASSGSTASHSPVSSASGGGARQVWKPCWDCNGSGECRYCHGKGWDYVTNSRGEIISRQQCMICHSSGRCQSCAGSRGHYEMEIF